MFLPQANPLALTSRVLQAESRGGDRAIAILVFVVLLSVFGCANYHYPFSLDELKAQGYTCVASGNALSMWQKEIQDEGRRMHLCVEPGRTTVGYVVDSSVLVDGKEAWPRMMGGGE